MTQPRLVLPVAPLAMDKPADGVWVELPSLPMGLPALSLQLLDPSGQPLKGVALHLVDASGALVIPIGQSDETGRAQLPAQANLDPLLLWRVESAANPAGPQAFWLPWSRWTLQQQEVATLDFASALIAVALAPRWAAWGRLSHEAQEPFAEWIAQDVAKLLAQLRPALLQWRSEEWQQMESMLHAPSFRGDAAPLQRVIPQQGPLADALATLGNRLANALLHSVLEGGGALPMDAQLALPLGHAEVPAVGDGVLDEVPVEILPLDAGGGGGGASDTARTPSPADVLAMGSVSLGFLPKAGGLTAPALPEGASTSGPLPMPTGQGGPQ